MAKVCHKFLRDATFAATSGRNSSPQGAGRIVARTGPLLLYNHFEPHLTTPRSKVALRSPLNLADCQARLAASVDAEHIAMSLSGFAGNKPFLGKIRGASFRLQKRRNYRNSFAPCFYGGFRSTDGGTLIEGEFRMHAAARIFMGIWFAFLAFFMIGALVWPAPGTRMTDRFSLLGFASLMAVFGVCLVKFGQRLGSGEQTEMMEFLRRELEATAIG